MIAISRRAALLLGAIAPALGRQASAETDNARAMVAQIIAIATDPGTMKLDPQSALQRIAFRGGKPQQTGGPNPIIYQLRDGGLTYGHLELSRTPNGWQLETLYLFFEMDDKIPLKALSEPLIAMFGEPRDETTGNTVLRWRGKDRSIEIAADVPGQAEMLVYIVAITRP